MENSLVVNAFVKHFNKVHLTYEAVGDALEALSTVSRDDIDNLMDHLVTNATPAEFLGICVNVDVGGFLKLTVILTIQSFALTSMMLTVVFLIILQQNLKINVV